MKITIFSVILVLILMGALAVAGVCIAGAFGLGVRVDQSNVGWAAGPGELRLVLIAAVAVAAAALITLRRLYTK